MNFKKAKELILSKLENELDPRLFYHGLSHTIDVIESATRIARLEKIKGKDLTILQTAALYHDSGFLFAYKGHETESARYARKTLPSFDYSFEDIEVICELIMATEVPQKPKSLLAEILCDADLDYLGRNDFKEISNGLFEEWKAYNIVQSEKDWYRLQINFLQRHFFHTPSANLLRNEKKMENLQKVMKHYDKIKETVLP